MVCFRRPRESSSSSSSAVAGVVVMRDNCGYKTPTHTHTHSRNSTLFALSIFISFPQRFEAHCLESLKVSGYRELWRGREEAFLLFLIIGHFFGDYHMFNYPNRTGSFQFQVEIHSSEKLFNIFITIHSLSHCVPNGTHVREWLYRYYVPLYQKGEREKKNYFRARK